MLTVDNVGTSGVANVILTSAYDAANNRTSLAAAIAGVDDFLSSSTYNALNQLTRLDQAGQSGGNSVAEKRIDFAYNAIGQFTSIARYKDTTGGSTHEIATSTYSYDLLNRLTGLVYKEGSTNLFTPYAWSFDNLSRVTQQVSEDGASDYAYDSTSQLTTADHDYQTDETYSYDANGNRTMTGYSTGTNNRLLNDGTHTYTYDFEGNRTKKTITATGEATEYEWDHRNRLVRVTHLDSIGDPIQTLDYAYDVLDRRIEKSDTPAVGPAYTERYVYDGEHLALKFGGSTLANRYLHGPVIDQILADEQVSSLSSPGDVLWPLADNLGTVRDLAEYDSGTGDTVIVNHISYDAYGGSRTETNAAVDHLFGYTGREWDAEADLQYNRARWYDPAVGRWLSEDPIGFQAGDVNLNRYVTNNPTTHFDPDGLRQRTGAWGPEYPRNRSESAAYAQWFEMNLPDMNNDFVINTWDVLDYLANGGAGLGDGVTFGYLNDAREYLGINNGIDQTSAIYTAGLYTGVAVGMGISGGAGGGAAATGWAVRTGRVYVMAAKADDVGTTASNILSGNVSLSDGMSIASGLPRSRVTRELGVSRANAQSRPVHVDIGGEGRYPQAINVNPSAVTSTTGTDGRLIPNRVDAPGENLPFDAHYADGISVENVPIYAQTALEISRVIRPGGSIRLLNPTVYAAVAHQRVIDAIRNGSVVQTAMNGITTTVITVPK